MAFRDFRDSTGVRWQAWDVIPRLVERRQGFRRRAAAPTGIANDRRSGMDRRIVTTRRGVLGDGLGHGWLCFESADEKRRLTPIPNDWTRCPHAQLERYCRDASPVRRPSGPTAAPTPIMPDPLAAPDAETPEEHAL